MGFKISRRAETRTDNNRTRAINVLTVHAVYGKLLQSLFHFRPQRLSIINVSVLKWDSISLKWQH